VCSSDLAVTIMPELRDQYNYYYQDADTD